MPITLIRTASKVQPHPSVVKAAAKLAEQKQALLAASKKSVTAARAPDVDTFPVSKLGFANKDFHLAKGEANTNFWAMYFGRHFRKGSWSKRPWMFWDNLILSAELDGLGIKDRSKLKFRPWEQSFKKKYKEEMKDISATYRLPALVQYLRVKKERNHFEVTIPVGIYHGTLVKDFARIFTNYEDLSASGDVGAPGGDASGGGSTTDEQSKVDRVAGNWIPNYGLAPTALQHGAVTWVQAELMNGNRVVDRVSEFSWAIETRPSDIVRYRELFIPVDEAPSEFGFGQGVETETPEDSKAIEYGDWEINEGGDKLPPGLPNDTLTRVKVLLRSGSTKEGLAKDFKWEHKDKGTDILEYAAEKASEAPAEVAKTLRVADIVATKNPYLSAHVLKHMKDFVQKFRIVKLGGTMKVLLMDIQLTAHQVSCLTTEPFEATQLADGTIAGPVDPLDVYSVMRTWVRDGKMEFVKNAASFMVPLSKVRRMNPTPRDFRTNADGIAIDQIGRFHSIPKSADNIDTYKSKLSERLRNEDNSYSGVDPMAMRPKGGKLPLMVLYVDWVNQKVAYTSVNGDEMALAMDRFMKPDETHYAVLYRRSIKNFDYVESSLSQAWNACYRFLPEFQSYAIEKQCPTFDAAFRKIYEKGANEGIYKDPADVRIIDLLQESTADENDSAALLGFFSTLKELDAMLSKDQTIAYKDYSVTGTFTLCAFVKIMATYDDVDTLSKVDQEKRGKYLRQGEDPNYKMEPVTLVRTNESDPPLAIMPHQLKTQNLTRESPDNAMLGIAAGGGKSLMSVLDYLKEIQRGNVDRALVIAPSHLVSTHVREIADFTAGRMNVIPVTSETFKRHGLEALKELILKRPINSVVVVSMLVLKRFKNVNYGPTASQVFFVAEWLRQFNFDYVVIDESHYLKNDGPMTRAVHRVIAGIKKKRIMSGTFLPNQPQDMVRQFALLDPTVFGSEEDFKREFGLEVSKAGKVTQWKPGYELEVTRRIKQHAVYVQIPRKEWAALLPDFQESWHEVDLTENQQAAYNAILTKELENLKTTKPELYDKINKLLNNITAPKEDEPKTDNDEDADEEETDDDGESAGDALERLLRPYISRMEQFTSAPAKDPIGGAMLTQPEDQISPKLIKMLEICRNHFENGDTSKIVIFTNQIETAEAAFEVLDANPEFKGRVIHYKATSKEEAKAAFEHDPKKVIMVGVGTSMDTGLNFQFCSRLIRLETVWTPGRYEQGNSRINRPNVKIKENRPKVYVDVIQAAGTIDIVKHAFLCTKIIQTEKMYNADNPLYTPLEIPELFAMTISNIFSMNNAISLADHWEKWEAFRQVQGEDFREYRKTHGELTWTPLERAPNPEGSKLLLRVPYEPGTELYAGKHLGLVRYDQHMNVTIDEPDEEDDEKDVEDLDETQRMRGTPIHTEFGDGELVSVSRKNVTVRLYSNRESVSVSKLSAFVITRGNTNGKDKWAAIKKLIADKADTRKALEQLNTDIPLLEEPEVPATDDEIADKLYKKKLKKQQGGDDTDTKEVVDTRVAVSLSFTVFNDTLTLSVDNAEEDRVADTMRQFGFANPPSYMYCELVDWRQYHKIILAWANHDPKFKMDEENAWKLKQFMSIIHNQSLKTMAPHGIARANDFKMFLRDNFKPNAKADFIKPFVLIRDNQYQIALPFQGQAGTRPAMMATKDVSPRPQWKMDDPEKHMYRFLVGKDDARYLIEEIQKSGQVKIRNLEALEKARKEVKVPRAQKGIRR